MEKVLCVCVGNISRSPMMQAVLQQHLGAAFRVESAGVSQALAGRPANHRSVACLQERGVDLSGHAPKPLTREMVDGAGLTVTMGCGVDAESCPAKVFFTEDWELEDPAGQGIVAVRAIRDQVRAKVEDLLDRLSDRPV